MCPNNILDIANSTLTKRLERDIVRKVDNALSNTGQILEKEVEIYMTAFSIMPAVSSPRRDSKCSLKISNGVGPVYGTIAYNAGPTAAGHEDIESWHGGVSSSKKKESLRLTLMKRLQPETRKDLGPEIKKNLDSLGRYWISLRGIYGPYYLPSVHQLPAVLLPDLFLRDGTFRLFL
jgi:hypothetical protein